MKMAIYTRKISARVTEEESDFLTKEVKKHDISESEYLRSLIKEKMIGKEIKHMSKEESKFINDLKDEVRRIGININQIIKRENSGYYSATEKKKLFAMMLRIEKMIGNL